MSKQIPRGPENQFCPDWKKVMSKVCHTCPLWMSVDVTVDNKNISEWRCAKLVTAQATVIQASLLNARMDELVKEVNALRNETKKSHDNNVAIGAIAVQRAVGAVKETIHEAVGLSRNGGSLSSDTTRLLES
jgi:hypothetical protein